MHEEMTTRFAFEPGAPNPARNLVPQGRKIPTSMVRDHLHIHSITRGHHYGRSSTLVEVACGRQHMLARD